MHLKGFGFGFWGTGAFERGAFTLARQVLYHLSHILSPFLLYFSNKFLLFALWLALA
jgi:hypothetical protein